MIEGRGRLGGEVGEVEEISKGLPRLCLLGITVHMWTYKGTHKDTIGLKYDMGMSRHCCAYMDI